MFEWSDLRHFLAVARHGSTLAAGRALQISQSTVQRRLGEQMLPFAERVEHAIHTFEQQKATIERGDHGVIRLTCPEPIMYRITQTALLDRFHAKYPGLRVEFVMSDRYLDISKGDADVALRSGDTEDGVLVGKKIADSIWAVYASSKYVDRHGKPSGIAELHRHPIIGFDGSMAKHRAATWLAEIAPGAEIVARVNSILGLVSAAKAGAGVAPLPTALGDAEADLVQVIPPVPELQRSWRLLTHPDLRHTQRISVFFEFISDEREALRAILTG